MDFRGLFEVGNSKRRPGQRWHLRVATVIIITALLLITFTPFSPTVLDTLASSFYYDFISEAEHASWASGAGALTFPGMSSDGRGFAVLRSSLTKLEDGSSGTWVLETHPEWVSNGWIMGRYPPVKVPAGAELRVTVGFLQGATESDGVTFEVQFEEGQDRQTILSQMATYDGILDSATQSLGALAGKTGRFILYVNAGQNSEQDRAVWVKAEIWTVLSDSPDLVTTEVWEDDGEIRYKIANHGGVSVVDPFQETSRFCNALFIDDELVAQDCVNINEMLPGQWIENRFDYAWQATQPEHEIKVCADWEGVVAEGNENNNCLEEIFEGEVPVADFALDSFFISPQEVNIGEPVTLGISVTNIGNATGSYTVILEINGITEATEEVTLDAGASTDAAFTTQKDIPGIYIVEVDGSSGSFTVREEVAPTTPSAPEEPPLTVNWTIFGPVIGILVFLAVFLPIRARRRSGM